MGEMLVFPLFFVFLDGFRKPPFFYAARKVVRFVRFVRVSLKSNKWKGGPDG